MGNHVSTAGRDYVEQEELLIDLRAAGATFATVVAVNVGLAVEFTYIPGQQQRNMGGAMEDHDEPELSELHITAIKARSSVLFENEGVSVVFPYGADMQPLLTCNQIEVMEENLLKRAEAN